MRTFIKSFLVVATIIFSQSLFAEQTGQPVRVTNVEKLPITRVVSTYGVLAPKIEDLSFRIDGRIASFYATEGETVQAGDVLAELEKRDVEDTLNQARVTRDQAQRQLERFEKLAKERMIQESQLEDARDTVETASINFDHAELTLQRCTLIAPANGVILKEYLDSRTTISAGKPIYSFRDVSGSWITEVKLTDQNAFTFGVGTTAKAKFAPYPGEVFEGKLTKQAGVADGNDGLYTVEVTITTRGRDLRPGMVVEIDLIHQTEEAFSSVPLDAMVDVRGNQAVIYLMNEAGDRVEELAVHILAITGSKVAIVEPIEPGRQVIVRGQQSLRNDTQVRVL